MQGLPAFAEQVPFEIDEKDERMQGLLNVGALVKVGDVKSKAKRGKAT